MSNRLMSVPVIVMVSIMLGCRSEPAAPPDATFATRNTYNMPAKVMVEKVKQAVTSPPISLQIETEASGRLMTSWEPHEGARVTVVGLGRTWEERTRYTITISPAWDDPSNKSTIEVAEESQQRPHDKWDWGSQDPVKRPERAAVLAKRIDAALASSSSSKP
jgi:hypothetical protein